MIFFLISFCLCSCAKEQFSVENVYTERTINIFIDQNGNTARYNESLTLTSTITGEGDFTFKVISPDGDLTWEGSIPHSGIQTLELPDGASFPEGNYKIIFYSEDGQDVEVNTFVPGVEPLNSVPRFLPYAGLSTDREVEVERRDDKKQVIDRVNMSSGDLIQNNDVFYISYNYRDRYLNQVVVEQALIEETD